MSTLTTTITELEASDIKYHLTTYNYYGQTYAHLSAGCVSFCPHCYTDTLWVEVYVGETYSHDECDSCGHGC